MYDACQLMKELLEILTVFYHQKGISRREEDIQIEAEMHADSSWSELFRLV